LVIGAAITAKGSNETKKKGPAAEKQPGDSLPIARRAISRRVENPIANLTVWLRGRAP
jgi:hypothetical protein